MPHKSLLRSTRAFTLPLPGISYICPSCRFHNVASRIRGLEQFDRRARRATSTIASVTTVNAKKDIPLAFIELYDALGRLQRDAAVYTNLSQLQLALRGLEAENAVTRVASILHRCSRAWEQPLIGYSTWGR